MHIYLIIISMFFVCSCGSRGYFDCPETKEIYQVIRKNNYKLAKMGLYERMNGGAGHPLTKTISEGYTTFIYRFSSVEEVRPFFCSICEELLRSLNAEMGIRQLVQNFPLTANNLDVFIFFYDEDGAILPSIYISKVKLRDGILSYYNKDENDEAHLLLSEPYEEAKKICLQKGTLMPV